MVKHSVVAAAQMWGFATFLFYIINLLVGLNTTSLSLKALGNFDCLFLCQISLQDWTQFTTNIIDRLIMKIIKSKDFLNKWHFKMTKPWTWPNKKLYGTKRPKPDLNPDILNSTVVISICVHLMNIQSLLALFLVTAEKKIWLSLLNVPILSLN